ncbi:MAG: acyl-CoA synthetase FdrA [Candidatus Methylomirabilia bacterium]
MAVRAIIRPSFYKDSVALMRVAEALRAMPGVREVAALMGTPANHELLASAGLATAETKEAGPGDLVLAVDAESDAQAAAALVAADDFFGARRQALEATVRILPRTLDSALRHMPGANLVAISVPGPYAKFEAMRALRRGVHVFLFSDNVSLADEVELKRLAVHHRLLCMGPDCGTAYVNGVGLGFANVVPRGRIGYVAASGTGLQAVVSHLAALGEGISQGIGVGGRDLSADVGGLMTGLALEALAADSATEVVVLISKPPARSVLPRLEAALGSLGKPVVLCCLGELSHFGGPVRGVSTLEDAAHAAAAALHRRQWAPRAFGDPDAIRGRLTRISAGAEQRGRGILGLYTGGTLAHEARLLLDALLGPLSSNLAPGGDGSPHRILDLGADELTASRPHPMLDPGLRAHRVREAGRDPTVGIILLDLVLGRGAHTDPAGLLTAAIYDARTAAARAGRSLAVVASVVGTAGDPQGLPAQVARLEAAGVDVLPSNAQAARFAALAIRPDLSSTLLPEPP